MAEEGQYSSDSGSNKRKYEEPTAPPTRRMTGFSGPIPSASPDPVTAPPQSYNSVPPPANEDVQTQVQNAKQRAQEIASRLLFNASVGAGAGSGAGAGIGIGGFDSKRARVDNGGGFDSSDRDGKNTPSLAPSAIPVAYNNYGQGSSKKIDIPNDRVGVIIGKGGETIKYLQNQSGAKIQVTRDADADPHAPTRMVELMGTVEQIARADQLIKEVLSEAEAGGSGTVSRRVTTQTGSEQFVMKVPNNKVGLVIGKGGETIKNMQNSTGARIQVVPLHLPPGDTSTERNLYIDGTSEQIEAAKQLVAEVISENRMRSSSMSGGYGQQGYQMRPPTNWGAPPMQQPGYGYAQPGAYPGAPQYMTQSQYGSYPPQPSSGSYASNWDQSAAPPSQPAGGYDYYSQQQPPSQQQQLGAPGGPAGSSDASGYNYSQPPAAATYGQQGHGYSQDVYGGYTHHAPAQPGYGQPPSYDQQQQSYSTSSGYSSATNPNQEGAAHSSYGAQGDSSQAAVPSVQPSAAMGQPGYSSAQPGYGMPPTSQPGYGPGYGVPQAQKPPMSMPPYGQSQQSPSAVGGYGQAAGYAQSQAQMPGYGQAPYGVPPASAAHQGGYAQQPAYGGYGGSGAYPQPPAYSADGSAPSGGTATRGGYDATPPASQAATLPAGSATKASPKT
ncbi:hypothetical protein SAY87_006714 [Trapa incisa]|uniref:K Homology domain-containing protein n=1 Tax=Trapa incisa TaxID=236973 RepID=A0AAN7PYX7_9MYRT|nr:hypothetical protein SAY87_006714 [Trapa incisa]